MGSESVTQPPVLPWYAIAVIIISVIVVLVIWYYMNSKPPATTSREMKLYYNKRGPKSYDFFNTLMTRRNADVPIYETRRDVEVYTATDEDFEREMNNLIPINANLKLVKPGDYVVSDTCYSSKQIAEMLRNHLSFPVDNLHVIATRNGKAHGKVWGQIPSDIVYHYGDNYHTDVISPYNAGIKSFHYDYKSDGFSETEHLFINRGLQKVAIILREMRLSNPMSKFIDSDTIVDMWAMQAEYNIPLLVIFILHIRRWLSLKKGIRKVYCILRDCWYLAYLMKKYLHMDVEIKYLYYSRKSLADTCVKENHRQTIEYFRRCAGSDDTVWIDISGTGRSMKKFTDKFGIDPHQLNLVRINTEERENGVLSRKADHMIVADFAPLRLETINSAPFGSFVRWDKNEPVLMDLEYPENFVNSGTDAIKYYFDNGYITELANELTDIHIDGKVISSMLEVLEQDERANIIYKQCFRSSIEE